VNAVANGTVDKNTAVDSKVSYQIYKNKNGILKQYDQEKYDSAAFKDWTEMQPFEAIQIQNMTMSDFSDETWDITTQNKEALMLDIKKASNWNNDGLTNVTVNF